MQVKTQPFKEAIELKSGGICFDVYGNGARRLGDLSVTNAGLVWCKGANGKAPRGKGINVKWEDFISWVQSQQGAAKNGAAKTAARGGGLPKLASAKPQDSRTKSRSLATMAKKPAMAPGKPAPSPASRAKKAN
jgi:hypothetical protein